MTKTKRAGSVAAEDRPERDPKACESLILRPPESTRQGAAPLAARRHGRRSQWRCKPMHVQNTCIPSRGVFDGTP